MIYQYTFPLSCFLALGLIHLQSVSSLPVENQNIVIPQYQQAQVPFSVQPIQLPQYTQSKQPYQNYQMIYLGLLNPNANTTVANVTPQSNKPVQLNPQLKPLVIQPVQNPVQHVPQSQPSGIQPVQNSQFIGLQPVAQSPSFPIVQPITSIPTVPTLPVKPMQPRQTDQIIYIGIPIGNSTSVNNESSIPSENQIPVTSESATQQPTLVQRLQPVQKPQSVQGTQPLYVEIPKPSVMKPVFNYSSPYSQMPRTMTDRLASVKPSFRSIPSYLEQSTIIIPKNNNVADYSRTLEKTPQYQQQVKNAAFNFYVKVDDNIDGNYQERAETRNGGVLNGKYAYDDGFVFRRVYYKVDANGFRVTKEEISPSHMKNRTGDANVQVWLDGHQNNYNITEHDIGSSRKGNVVQ